MIRQNAGTVRDPPHHAIDARKSPTAVNNLAMNKSYEWFEANVIYRVPLIMYYFGGLSREEMAKELQCKPGTLGVRRYGNGWSSVAGDGAGTPVTRDRIAQLNASTSLAGAFGLLLGALLLRVLRHATLAAQAKEAVKEQTVGRVKDAVQPGRTQLLFCETPAP